MSITKEAVSNIGGGKVLKDGEFVEPKKLKKDKNPLTSTDAKVKISKERSS